MRVTVSPDRGRKKTLDSQCCLRRKLNLAALGWPLINGSHRVLPPQLLLSSQRHSNLKAQGQVLSPTHVRWFYPRKKGSNCFASECQKEPQGHRLHSALLCGSGAGRVLMVYESEGHTRAVPPTAPCKVCCGPCRLLHLRPTDRVSSLDLRDNPSRCPVQRSGQCPLTYHQTWGREGPTGFLHIERQERWAVFQLVAPCTDGRFETPLCLVTRVLPCEVSVPRGKTALRNRGTHREGYCL